MAKNTFYVTTPIYYVTAKPHVGSLYSTVLADVAAKYHQLLGKETFFLTGTDEHGQKIAQAAQKAEKEPKVFVDGLIDAYKDTWKLYHLDYNQFIRTTDQYHMQAVQSWITQLLEKGDIYKDSYSGWYCVPCESFVTDKHVELGVKEIPCPDCNRPTTWMHEECYFFRLSAYQEKLLDFYKKNPNFITPKERMQEVISFVQGGLKDLSISRTTISWGIPFPGDSKHVTYVWADALNNYITAIGYLQQGREEEFKKWWPANMQILGKDIVRFHAVYWPAFLMASGLELPKTLLVHGWLKIGDQKMSKSLGNAVDPVYLAQQYGVDEIRYYLSKKMALTQDSEFSTTLIEETITGELANELGNLLNRISALTEKYAIEKVKPMDQWSSQAQTLHKKSVAMMQKYQEHMNEGMMYRGFTEVMDFVKEVNAYFHHQEPWKQAKDNGLAFLETLSACTHALHVIAVCLWPAMPVKMEQLLASIGIADVRVAHEKDSPFGLMHEALRGVLTAFTGPIEQPNIIRYLEQSPWNREYIVIKIEPLFAKIESKHTPEESKVSEEKVVTQENQTVENYIDITDFAKVEMRVGTIMQVEEVEGSDKLLKLQVDFGLFGKRQILSGVKKSYMPADLQGKQAVFVVNLKPRKMMGIPSEGMMLFALEGDKQRALTVLQAVEPGTKVG